MPKEDCNNFEPCVGIFWWFRGQLIVNATPLSRAEPYGDALTHSTGHFEYWSGLQEAAAVPVEIDYEAPPRGRVSFDRRRERFLLYADRCILRRATVIRAILSALHLPEDTELLSNCDSHYRCARCLRLAGSLDHL